VVSVKYTIKGGDKLQRALAEAIGKFKQGEVLRVGFLEKAKYPDGTPVALVAAIQNFGAPSKNIPPRPFFSNMIRSKSPSWPKEMATLAQTLKGSTAVLTQMGERIKDQLQQSIHSTNDPPLSPKTIARKGFSKTLIDTKKMLDSVDYEVVNR
jgi:hypothetical protein